MEKIVIILVGFVLIINGILLMIKQIKTLFEKKEIVEEKKWEGKDRSVRNGREVIINGKKYPTIKAAADEIGILPATMNGWVNRYKDDEKKIIEKIENYQYIKREKDKVIICGYYFKNWDRAARLLGYSPSTLRGWNNNGLMERRIKENKIDIDSIAKKNNIPLVKKEEIKKREERGRRKKGEWENMKIKISSLTPNTYLKRYDLKCGDEYNIKKFMEHCGCSKGLIYSWMNKKYIEII